MGTGRVLLAGFFFLLAMFAYLRLALEPGGTQILPPAKTLELASCLKPPAEIPAGAAISLLPVAWSDVAHTSTPGASMPDLSPPEAKILEFRATAPIPLDLPDDMLQTAQPGKPLSLPEDYLLNLIRGKGAFEFALKEGTVRIARNNAHFLLRASEYPVRFGPTEVASYVVRLGKNSTAVVTEDSNKKKRAELPINASGTLQIARGQSVVPLQPLTVAHWVHGISATLQPVRVSGQPGLSDVAIEAKNPGVRFDAPGFTTTACVFVDGKRAQPAGVSETKPQTASARMVLALPQGSLENAFTWSPTSVELVVASFDGQYVGYGTFKAVPKGFSAIAALVVTCLLFAGLAFFRRSRRGATETRSRRAEERAAGLFLGEDGTPSLSLLQVFLWTVITVWGFLYVFIVVGGLISLTPEMMGLLGIAGVGSVAARLVAGASRPMQRGNTASPEPDITLRALLSSDGRFDLMKLQLLVFTVVIAIYVVARILDTAAFPVLDTNTLLLMGVSQGVYVGGKLAGATALGRAQAAKVERDTLAESLDQLKKKQNLLGTPATGTPAEAQLQQVNKDIADAEKRLSDLDATLKNAAKELGIVPKTG